MTASRRPRRRVAPALLLAVAALLAGCSGAPAAAPDPAPPARPSGPPAPDNSCDPTASLRPAAAGLSVQQIRDRGRLVVGTSQDTLLFSSLDPAGNAIEGFDVDIANLVAAGIFGSAEGRVQFVVLPSAEREEAVRSGRVDLVAQTMTVNCARRQNVEFSTVYYDAGQRLLVGTDSTAASLADLAGRRVCAVPGSTSVREIQNARPPVHLVTASTWGGCLVAFQQNQADAIATDDTILAGLAAQDPYAKVVGQRITDEPYGLAVSRDRPDLTRFVNGVLARAREDGTWASIYDRWLTRLGPAPQPPAARYRD